MFEENNQEKRMNKSLIYAVAGVALLVIAVSGSAYAYFSASATNTNAITGKTLDVQLSIASLRKVSKGTGDLIPIYDGTVTGHASQSSTATNSTNDCVDKNGYTVCKVYKISVKNSGTTATTVNTTLNLNNGGVANIKWARMTSSTVVDTTLPTNSTVSTGKELGAGATLEQYIMVYLKNTGADQTSTDAGRTISGTVTVTASTGANVQAEF